MVLTCVRVKTSMERTVTMDWMEYSPLETRSEPYQNKNASNVSLEYLIVEIDTDLELI